MTVSTPSAAEIREALAEVADPEIPAISIVDLGIVREVAVEGRRIRVELLPTFVGCPALDVIRDAVRERLGRLAPGCSAEVEFTFVEPWTTERITPAGREALRASGLGPPVPADDLGLIDLQAPLPCPYCGSRRTVLENAFGPTACRSIRYCTSCRQPFEQLKTV
ncbi:MAG TPA: 1,2-phenylacetyl-CoA epoxidase subunit PaaD [Candidatus Limnocylindrales bacterium]|nr:1,2-phenylacetyl-CoA epoxidase subunit PaaD [Candidatus Limnocylindrales bacterium]